MTDKVNMSTARFDDGSELNAHIACRIAARRKAAGLSLDRLASLCAVSKGMLVQIEQGRANPSIAMLCRIARGLRTSVAELVEVAEDAHNPVRIVEAGTTAPLWEGPNGGYAALLIGSDGPDMLELWSWQLHPDERYEAQTHPPGAVELISVTEGRLSLEVDGTAYIVKAGDAVFARTDRRHAYVCMGRKPVRFTMVVSEPGRSPD